MLDRHEDAAEIKGVHKNTRNADMKNLPRIAWPLSARDQREGRHQAQYQNVTCKKESQRIGIGQAELGANETGAPQEYEEDGSERFKGRHGVRIREKPTLYRVRHRAL